MGAAGPGTPPPPSEATTVQQLVLEERSFLLEEFGALSSQVRNAESTLMDISHLSQMFTEQVLKQGQQIEQMYMDAGELAIGRLAGGQPLSQGVGRVGCFCMLFESLMLGFVYRSDALRKCYRVARAGCFGEPAA